MKRWKDAPKEAGLRRLSSLLPLLVLLIGIPVGTAFSCSPTSGNRINRSHTKWRHQCAPTTAHRGRSAFSVGTTSLPCQKPNLDEVAETEDSSDQMEAPVDSYAWTSKQFKLSIPALLSLLADPLLSLVDTAFVGRLGTTSLAALGACTSVFHLAFNTFRATTLATTSLVGPYYANKKNQTAAVNATSDGPSETELEAVARLSLKLGGALGVGVALALLLAGARILEVMGIPRNSPLYPDAMAYLSTRAWAAPCVAFTAVMTGLFRGAGTTIFPLIASVFASVLNLILDPFLMFGNIAWGVRGAAAATAWSQLGAAIVLAVSLLRQGLIKLQRRVSLSRAKRTRVLTTIFKANFSMIAKQGSLLGAWAYCTARATRLGPAHVAAHQVALSVWLVVALALDSNAIGAQILASRYFRPSQERQSSSFFSLLRYQAKLAVGQGVLASVFIATVLAPLVPMAMGTDPSVRYHLQQLMPTLALQQVLVSCCLVSEALASATQQFTFLAIGTIAATALSVWQLRSPTTVTGLWNRGIVTLFLGRWITALLALRRAIYKNTKKNNADDTPFDANTRKEKGSHEVLGVAENATLNSRSAVAAPGVDLSGTWKPIITSQFKQDYNEYLQCCGESTLKRKFYMTVLSLTGERLRQYDENGASQLELTGTSPVGEWKRTLVASAPNSTSSEPILTPVRDPDGDTVTVEAFWTDEGNVHESWMRGKPRVCGGSFQSRRYLEPNGDESDTGEILICESRFHPADDSLEDARKNGMSKFKPGFVKWRFSRSES